HERLGRVHVGVDEPLAHGVEGDLAGDLAGGVASHAVGHREDGIDGEHAVLVDGAQATDVGGGTPPQRDHTASRTVEPTCRLSPLCRGVGALTRWLFTYVPFVDPRSSTYT